MDKIDFVILWVDGDDSNWQDERSEYNPVKVDYASNVNRFRDWDNLHYWFRGVEKYAPWVNNIYFITWGHLPKWLNTKHPKLKIVKHTDYIEGYLPTFNSNVIELNLHKIQELSEHFVLFNDDTFLLNSVKPTDFFINKLPRDEMYFNAILPKGDHSRISYTNLNNTNIINKYFIKKEVMKKHWKKVINFKYGTKLIRTLLLMPWNCFVGFGNPHIPQPHLKSTFSLLWEKEYEKLDDTCKNKFRGLNDCSHWLMRYWNLCSGNFVPRKSNFAKYFNLSNDNSEVCSFIKRQKSKMICINDMSPEINFEKAKAEIKISFDTILDKKSSYEI